jgi:Papain family cysteine protease
MSSITVRKDLRGQFGPPRDQGQRPTCLAFAMSDTHAAVRGPWADLSCEYLFYHAKQREKAPPSAGAKPSFIRQALEHDGQPVEADWKYLDALPGDLSLWVPPTKIGAVFKRSSAFLPGGFDEAWNKVEAGTPVMIVMTISDAFYMPDNVGVVNSPELPDPVRRHAVVAAATGEVAGVRCLLGRNSWGETWGLQGHAWLAEPYLKPRISLMVTMN